MRHDMSDFLIHFTKGEDDEHAYHNLKCILDECEVRGSIDKIRDGSLCVCFSEAPLSSLTSGLLNPSFYSPYSAFGVITSKAHIFSQGGRPVIYQPESEFDQLSSENSWRHVRYDPPNIDYSWEREWRLKSNGYHLNPSTTQILVPDRGWARRLIGEHEDRQRWQTLQYSQIIDELLAMQYEESFPWIVVAMNGT